MMKDRTTDPWYTKSFGAHIPWRKTLIYILYAAVNKMTKSIYGSFHQMGWRKQIIMKMY